MPRQSWCRIQSIASALVTGNWPCQYPKATGHLYPLGVYNHRPKDVMDAVQNSLRAKAKAAGNLKTTSQITVVQQSPSTIVIQPSNPQVIYVPEYNPTVIYGNPYVVPGYTAGEVAAANVFHLGRGLRPVKTFGHVVEHRRTGSVQHSLEQGAPVEQRWTRAPVLLELVIERAGERKTKAKDSMLSAVLACLSFFRQ